MKKFFIGCYNKSVILTHIGIISAILGMSYLAQSLKISVIFLIFSGICDMFDGAIARMCKRTEKEKEFGIQLDSLADTISFVIFPVVMLLHITQYSLAGIIVSSLYSIAGVTRLGWFNIMTEENKGFYQGLPVTFSALIIPAAYTILKLINFINIPLIFTIIYTIIACAFISNFKLKKPGKKFLILFLVLAIIMIVTLVFIS